MSVFEASRASGVPDFGSSLFHSSVAGRPRGGVLRACSGHSEFSFAPKRCLLQLLAPLLHSKVSVGPLSGVKAGFYTPSAGLRLRARSCAWTE